MNLLFVALGTILLTQTTSEGTAPSTRLIPPKTTNNNSGQPTSTATLAPPTDQERALGTIPRDNPKTGLDTSGKWPSAAPSAGNSLLETPPGANNPIRSAPGNSWKHDASGDSRLGAPGGAEASPRRDRGFTGTGRDGLAGDAASGAGWKKDAGRSTSRRPTPPELVAQLLTPPPGGTITGRPVSLLEAVSAAKDRPSQLEAIHTYWRTVGTLAEYRFYLEEADQLRQLQPRQEDQFLIRNERILAMQRLRQAEVVATQAQRDLAAAMNASPGAPLPFPADLPHVGPYRTNFDEVYASQRSLPPRPRLIHRTLPVARQAIDSRTAAVLRAEEARQEAIDGYRAGETDLSLVLGTLAFWGQQSRQLIRSVCEYNHEIANYALTVVGPQLDVRTLVGMLIKSNPDLAPAEPLRGSGAMDMPPPRLDAAGQPYVSQATWVDPVPGGQAGIGMQRAPGDVRLEPLPAGTTVLVPPSGRDEPTLAPPRDAAVVSSSPRTGQPTLAPPQGVRQVSGEAMAEQPTLAPSRAEPTLAPPPPRELTPDANAIPILAPSAASKQEPTLAPPRPEDTSKPTTPTVRTANWMAPDAPGSSALVQAIYPALADAAPAMRVKQLTGALHWNRALPKQVEKPTESDLKDCLSRVPASVTERRAVVEAYWFARQRAAEYQVFTQQYELFSQLSPIAGERGTKPGGAREMIRLQAALSAAKADQEEAHVALLRAQFELTARAGRPLDSAWLLPTTVPHSGQYLLKLDAQPPELVKSWTLRRLATAVPALSESLQQHASAVVSADVARATATANYQGGTRPIDSLLPCIRYQTVETLAFLETLTGYNRAIVEYALTVLPANLPADRFVQTLVVQ